MTRLRQTLVVCGGRDDGNEAGEGEEVRHSEEHGDRSRRCVESRISNWRTSAALLCLAFMRVLNLDLPQGDTLPSVQFTSKVSCLDHFSDEDGFFCTNRVASLK